MKHPIENKLPRQAYMRSIFFLSYQFPGGKIVSKFPNFNQMFRFFPQRRIRQKEIITLGTKNSAVESILKLLCPLMSLASNILRTSRFTIALWLPKLCLNNKQALSPQKYKVMAFVLITRDSLGV